MITVELSVNATSHRVPLEDPDTPLVYVLRNRLGLTGCKIGCGLEQCGSCAVLVDGVSRLSCVTPAREFEGTRITTIEGLGATPVGRRVQRAFVTAGAAQCGYCTAGIIVALSALLQRGLRPSQPQLRAALEPHLCRCGAHPRILAAVRQLTGEDMTGEP